MLDPNVVVRQLEAHEKKIVELRAENATLHLVLQRVERVMANCTDVEARHSVSVLLREVKV